MLYYMLCLLLLMQTLLFIFAFLLWFDLANVDVPVHVAPDGQDTNCSPAFSSGPTFAFRFAGWFIFERRNGVFWMDRSSYICSSVILH